eukprot:1147424-Pelagomonas_calceolata.AAC.4
MQIDEEGAQGSRLAPVQAIKSLRVHMLMLSRIQARTCPCNLESRIARAHATKDSGSHMLAHIQSA